MLRLIDRNRSIPYGFKFKLPEAKWEASPQSSFTSIVNGAMAVAKANPHIAKQSQWPTTLEGWENKVDLYNAALCKAHGWTGFYLEAPGEGGPIPKSTSPLQFAGRAAAGVAVLSEMFGPDGPVKDQELVNRRAATCVKRANGEPCPKHDKGDWTRFFTKPAQALIIKALAILKDMDLHSDYDDNLQTCTACGCPMKGKVHARIDHILKHIPDEDKAALDPGCWILAEENLKGKVAIFHVRENDPTPAT